MKDNATEIFARHIVAYREWLLHGTSEGPLAAKETLEHLLTLYSAALALPYPNDPSAKGDELPDNTDDAYASLRVKCQRIPIGYYGEVFNPLVVPPEEPVVGDLADDLSDIYRDLIRGLRYYELGRIDEALWEWRFHLRIHWGEHATSAIHALHWWLSKNTGALFEV